METTGSNEISAFFHINADANFPAVLAYPYNFIIKLHNVTLQKTHKVNITDTLIQHKTACRCI